MSGQNLPAGAACQGSLKLTYISKVSCLSLSVALSCHPFCRLHTSPCVNYVRLLPWKSVLEVIPDCISLQIIFI